MTYQEAIDWLYGTQLTGIKLGLDGPKRLLRQFLANPKPQVKVAHIAGTNGKGSTSAMIDSLARCCGMRSGLFTSPHLIDFRERICVNGEMIPEAKVAQLLTELRALVKNWEHPPTFFEITLAIAMRHFKDSDCELIVLETGMGGRLDATTAVPADVAIITPIALDHSQWLGDTLEKVALEKAGIIVPEKPTISAAQHPEAATAIAEVADQLRSPLTIVDAPLSGYHITLPGAHQAENAALALESAAVLGLPLNFDIVQHALATVQWPGRFETLSQQPHIIIDGAHNPHAAAALATTWKSQFPKQKATLIFSAVDDKDVSSVLQILCPIAEEIHFCPIDSPRTLDTDQLGSFLPADHPPVTTHASLQSCLSALANHQRPILIAGSLFLIGEAKALWERSAFRSSWQ